MNWANAGWLACVQSTRPWAVIAGEWSGCFSLFCVRTASLGLLSYEVEPNPNWFNLFNGVIIIDRIILLKCNFPGLWGRIWVIWTFLHCSSHPLWHIATAWASTCPHGQAGRQQVREICSLFCNVLIKIYPTKLASLVWDGCVLYRGVVSK